MTDISGGGNAFVTVSTSVGSALRGLLDADELRPGDDVSYQLCKDIYINHPLGGKMAEGPVRLAQSQEREITVPDSPEDEVLDAYRNEWENLELSRLILNVATQARIYGIAAAAMGEYGKGMDEPGEPVKLTDLWKKDIFFNVFDPLNMAGSMVRSQDPNSPLYQKQGDLYVQGVRYHRSRVCTLMNEEPLYIAWTASSYGYVGRSVYQRALYPLKSFIQTMITDDMVTRKAGLIVARMEQVGTFVDKIMMALWGTKRQLLKQAKTDNVLSIGKDEIVETLNLRNVNDSMNASRENILKNIATSADMPAKLLSTESFVEGFGEGTQDAYAVAQYVDRTRIELRKIYKWCDIICMYRAWNPEFYKSIQSRFEEEYGDVTYEQAFYKWKNAFTAVWPSLIKEKPSEAVDIDKVKMESINSIVQIFAPMLDPENRARLITTAYDQFNTHEALLGGAKFDLDPEALLDHFEKEIEQQDDAFEASMQGDEEDEGDEDSGEGNAGAKTYKSKPPKPNTLGRDSLEDGSALGEVINLLERSSGRERLG